MQLYRPELKQLPVSYCALIPAAGSGQRAAAGAPKQYAPLCGRPMLWHAVRAVCVPPVQSVFVVLAPGDNSFAENPPNAVLSFADEGDRPPTDAVVVIEHPKLDGDELSYSIKLLDGDVPTAAGSCALFIDPFGRPLSPVSAAGMHRRARRRRRF